MVIAYRILKDKDGVEILGMNNKMIKIKSNLKYRIRGWLGNEYQVRETTNNSMIVEKRNDNLRA